jgi:single-strand DNA-binding protein
MNDINHTIVIGRLTRDCDFGYITTGTARANISVAVNENRKGQNGWTDYPNYFDVTIWGKTAENLKPYLTKGKRVAIDGHLHQDRWEKDGQKYSKVVIIANNVQLLGGNESAPQAQQPVGEYQSTGSGDDFPEDIPF